MWMLKGVALKPFHGVVGIVCQNRPPVPQERTILGMRATR